MNYTHQLHFQSSKASETGTDRLMPALFCFILLLVGMSSMTQAQTRPAAQQQDDTQQWNDIQFATALSKKVDLNLYGTFRFGRDISHLVDRRVGVGFTFKVGKYLTFTPSYLNITMRPFENRKVDENRLVFAGTVRVPLGKFVVSDRNQFERRFRFPINSTRYRNRLQIEHPIKVGDMAMSIFASDEVFYDWSVDHWVRNRFAVGVSRKFNQHFTGDIYYMRQNDGRARPGDLNIIGVTYRIRY